MEAKPTEITTESSLSTASSPEDRSPGILTSFLGGTLSWPLRVTRDLLDIPSRLSNWMHGFLHATHLHFRDNAYNYTYLYELLSLGVPLLCVLLEVLTHMYREAELSLENMLEWVKRFCRVWIFLCVLLSCAFQIFKINSLAIFSRGIFGLEGFVFALRAMWRMTSLNGGFLLIEVRYNWNFQRKMYCMLEHEGQCPNTFPEHGVIWRIFSRLFSPLFYSVIRLLAKMVHFETIFLPTLPSFFFFFFSLTMKKCVFFQEYFWQKAGI